jgi:transposase
MLNTVAVSEDSLSNEMLRGLLAQRDSQIAELTAAVVALTSQVEGLRRQLGKDSSNSSKPPGSDSLFAKPAPKRSSRSKSGRKPGKQAGAVGISRGLSDDPDRKIVTLEPEACRGCGIGLGEAATVGTERRQVVDVPEPLAPAIVEYQRVSKCCSGCGKVTAASWDHDNVPAEHAATIAGGGSPVRIGPRTIARCALLTCAHYLPVGRARDLLELLTGIGVSHGLVAAVRGRAARKLSKKFAAHLRELLISAPVLHADETTGRADGGLSYVHVACTQYLTLMHVGGRSADDIDDGGVLPDFDGVLVRDGYAGYTHLDKAIHAWCGAHLLRDLRSISDADPEHQLWASAMASVLTDAHRAATAARADRHPALAPELLASLRNRYLGALRLGRDENDGKATELVKDARILIKRFRRFEDMILRFATDLTVPWTNNEADRTLRPVKIQQRTSGGTWRTVQGLIDFAMVTSYLDTAQKWSKNKLDALHELFTTGAWLPPAPTPDMAAA